MAYGAERAGWTISVNTEVKGQLRDVASGRFISPKINLTEVIAVNRATAQQVLAEVIENIENRIIRRGVSTGRLIKATANRKNWIGDQFGWGVGNEEYLDGSIAKYWRQIEEGTDIHVGREIRGIWGDSTDGFYNNKWGRVPSAGPNFSESGDRRGGKFAPRRNGRYFDPETGAVSQFRRPGMRSFRKTTIEQPIEAMDAYRDAFYAAGRHFDRTAEAAAEAVMEAARRIIPGY